MSQRFFKPNRPIMLVTALALLCGVRTSHAQISVRVNDSMVRFDRVGPMQIGGSVFIPLRAVGDSLGVDLHWEEATQTITGKKSPHVFVLKLGSKYASVDDQSVTLSSPARTVNGVTMVPLRFVAEALGAEVRWRPELSMVTITTDAPMPTTPPVPIVTTLKGEVVGVQSKGNSPSITIRTSQGRTRFDITRDTVVMRGLSGDRGSPSDLDQVVLGNSVEIKPDPSGSIALSIKELVAPPAPSTRVVGDIISVQQKSDPPTISVNTSTGRVRLEITPDTIILSGPVGSRGVQTDLDRLALGSKVEIRTDAAGAVAISIRENLPVPVAAALPVKTAPPIMKAGISSFQITRAAIIRAGSQVNVNMVGTPGGTATFSVGDLAQDIPMQEDSRRPGNYTGSFTAPQSVTAMGVGVFGRLRMGNQTAPIVQAGPLVNIDSEPPRINLFAPDDRSTVMNDRPEIFAEISDGVGGSGIDTDSVQLLVNGQDVTSRARISTHLIMYVPTTPLPLGNCDVRLIIADKAGNETKGNWGFRVAAAPEVLRSVTHDYHKALVSGDSMIVQARALPGGRATFVVQSVPGKIAMQEVSPGLYEGRFNAVNGMVADHVPVTVEFTAPDGRKARQSAALPISIATVLPPSPKITMPADNAPFTRRLVVGGTGRPGDTITVTVGFNSGEGITSMKGSLGTFATTVDAQGQWMTRAIIVNLPFGIKPSNLHVTAIASDAANQRSAPTIVDYTTK